MGGLCVFAKWGLRRLVCNVYCLHTRGASKASLKAHSKVHRISRASSTAYSKVHWLPKASLKARWKARAEAGHHSTKHARSESAMHFKGSKPSVVVSALAQEITLTGCIFVAVGAVDTCVLSIPVSSICVCERCMRVWLLR